MSFRYTIRNKRYINPTADLSTKIILITGANTGLGKSTALELARRNAKIYFACRDETKTLSAIEEIQSATSNDNLYFLKLDLSSLDSIRECSENFHKLEQSLDILICNAGVLSPNARTSDNFEMNMGVNHLGHFLLTNLLLDMLKSNIAPSRIIIVASQTYMVGSINKEDFNSEKNFSNVWMHYANSKLANLLFMHELSIKLKGTKVTCNALCPGTVQTEAARYLNPVMKFFMKPMMKLFYSTPEVGCQTCVMLAVEPSLEKENGSFFVGCRKKDLMAKATDDDLALWLWEKSIKMTGLNN